MPHDFSPVVCCVVKKLNTNREEEVAKTSRRGSELLAKPLHQARVVAGDARDRLSTLGKHMVITL
jgi:hypothetical protein